VMMEWIETSSESCTKSGFVIKDVKTSENTIQGRVSW
jgi:hypothetical protein